MAWGLDMAWVQVVLVLDQARSWGQLSRVMECIRVIIGISTVSGVKIVAKSGWNLIVSAYFYSIRNYKIKLLYVRGE